MPGKTSLRPEQVRRRDDENPVLPENACARSAGQRQDQRDDQHFTSRRRAFRGSLADQEMEELASAAFNLMPQLGDAK